MNLNQDQKPLAVQDVQKAQSHLIEMRNKFFAAFGHYPGVMYVGVDLFRTAFPVAHTVRPGLAEAIDTTLVIPKDTIPGFGLVIIKPPECRKAA